MKCYIVPTCYCIFIENVINFVNIKIHTSDRHDNGLVTRGPNMDATFHHASDMHLFCLSLVHLPVTGILLITSDTQYQ
jgi:hypothetical protein